MTRTLLLFSVIAALASNGAADTVVLTDGRTFIGTVQADDDGVVIQTEHALLKFARDQVYRVEIKDTPQEEYRKKLAKIAPDDADGLFGLAQWASANGLERQGQDLYVKVLQVNPDHAATHKLLGYVKIDTQWQTFAKGIELAHGRLDAAQYDSLVKTVLPALDELATTRDKQALLRELAGLAQLRSNEFAAAGKTFAALALASDGPAAIRHQAIADILAESDKGVYILAEPYPLSATLLGPDKQQLKAGPASLADPFVLEAALHDRARKEIDAGRKILDAAAKLEPAEADTARTKYVQAGLAFDRAEALVPDIARSYRIEIARRKIAAIRRQADADSEKYSRAMEKLGGKTLAQQEYQATLTNLIKLLDTVRDDLQDILTVAKPYTRELVLELKWAEIDLKKTEALRTILTDEINGQK